MAVLLLVAFVVVPLLELYVIVQVSHGLGVLPTLALLLLISVAGSLLVKREGVGLFRRFQAEVGQGRVPTDEIVEGVLVLGAGALLLTPGFVTDGVGFLLLLPPTRAGLRRLVVSRVQRRASTVVGAAQMGARGGTWVWATTTRRRSPTDVGTASVVDTTMAERSLPTEGSSGGQRHRSDSDEDER
ncbi:MAG: FxsA family protein [Acidimicrobiia bacterium]|nr:FxsA family protein [Acidimicrobiia bacterium]